MTNPNHKQFGSYIDTVVEAIVTEGERNGTDRRETQPTYTIDEIVAGLREVLGNADHVFWAAEEAFLAGFKASDDGQTNPLIAWAQYTPSDAVVDRVQGGAVA